MLAALPLSARDIHGVKGYYNYTPSQMLQDNLLYLFRTGYADANWTPSYAADGDFLVTHLGVQNATRNEWMSSVGFGHNNNKGFVGNLRITKNYPVVAFKFCLPVNVADSTDTSMSAEFWWTSPYTGKSETMSWNDYKGGFEGLSNGRSDWAHIYRGRKITAANAGIMQGRDSVKLRTDNRYSSWTATDDGVAWTYIRQKLNTDTSMVIMRLPDETGEEGVKSEFVLLLNYYAIPDTASAKDGSRYTGRLLDRMDIQSVGWHIMSTGHTNIEDAVEAPVSYVKWMKTFPSLSAAIAAISKANNFGDGTESAAKSQLNYGLYYAEQNLRNYSFRNEDPSNPDDAAYIAYKNAYDNANAVYNSESSTDADYAAASTALQEARVALLSAADINSGLVYNYIKSSTGSGGIVIGNSDVTVGSITGKPLTIGSNDAAAALSFVATGNVVNGQKTYTLSSAQGSVVQATDGTLLVVDGAAGSTFTFSELDAMGQGFSIQCGEYYYYIDGNGVLSAAKEIPEEASSDFDAMSAYLFTITDALADYKDKAGDEENTGLKSGWELNEAPVEDPGTHGFYNGQELTMSENGETKMIEGWRMSRWRMQSRVNQETVKNSDGTDATCIVLSSAPTYSSYDGQTTGIVNGYTTPPAMRMDAGTEDPFYKQDPSPRDSTWAFEINPGMNRYFAIKMKGTNDAAFGTLNFFNAKKSVQISSANIAGKKGDVIYFDLLNSGFAIGKQLYSAMFFSPVGFSNAGDKMYIDWMRFYDTVDEIPAESFADDAISTAIKGIGNASEETAGAKAVYSINGTLMGSTTNGLQPGVYVVRQGGKAHKVIVK